MCLVQSVTFGCRKRSVMLMMMSKAGSLYGQDSQNRCLSSGFTADGCGCCS